MPETPSGAEFDRDALAALLDTFLPGDDAWPGASEIELAATVVDRVGMAEGHAEAIGRLLAALPDTFGAASVDERERTLRAHEGTEDFGAALLVAYDAYYIHSRVLELLETRCGYATHPPQPTGFQLEPFNESRLSRVREREPFWRKA